MRLKCIVAIDDKKQARLMKILDEPAEDNYGLIEMLVEETEHYDFELDLPMGIYETEYVVQPHSCQYPECACDGAEGEFENFNCLWS